MREIGEELVALMSQNGWASVEMLRGKSHQREEKEKL
jgi:hypothetical protein